MLCRAACYKLGRKHTHLPTLEHTHILAPALSLTHPPLNLPPGHSPELRWETKTEVALASVDGDGGSNGDDVHIARTQMAPHVERRKGG